MSSTPTLRGHHIICLHFYKGEGYDDFFISSLNKLIDDVYSKGVFIVEGADDVCNKCPNLLGDKCVVSDNADKEIQEMDKFALSLINKKAGMHILWDDIKVVLPLIIDKWYEKCCITCLWLKKCAVRDMHDSI